MKKINKMILLFFVTSFLGFILETIIALFQTGKFEKTGALHIPFCVIYGTGIIIIYLLIRTPYRKIFFKIKKKFKQPINLILVFSLYFFLSYLIIFTLEFSSGLFIDKVLNKKLWDYNNQKDNILGYVSLSVLAGFSIGATFFMWHLFPRLMKIFEKIPLKILLIINIILISITLTDILIIIFS